jgi:hypothetical protein
LRVRKYELSKKTVIEQWGKNYPNVMTWIAKLQKKNQAAWHLWLYCKTMRKSPDELLALKSDPRIREAEHLLDKFVADESLDIPNSIKVNVAIAVKSFYEHNYCGLAKKSGAIDLIKQKPYRRHSKEELIKIYRATQNPRDRSLITFTWSSAIAKESLTKVQWKHLEADWEKQELPHIGLPSEIIKGHGRGKYRGVEQHTFLTPEAKRDLIDYKDRLERTKGKKVLPENTIFVQTIQPFNSLTDSSLSRVNTLLAKRSGVLFSWHDARRYVETALEETKIHPNWARKIRGRKVKGEESPYSRPAIEQLRQAYKEAVPLLEFTQPTQLMELQKRQQIVEQITSKLMSGEPLTDDDRANMKRYSIQLREHAGKRTVTDGGDCGEAFEQIDESQLLNYLKAGWTVAHKLANGEVIVKR